MGGAAELIWFVMSTCVSKVANLKLTSLAGNRMYTGNSNIQLTIPRYLVWQTILLPNCGSCGVNKSKNNVKQVISTVKADLSHNLDIVNLLARLRMHGFALALLLD